jgi:hypothetical protein
MAWSYCDQYRDYYVGGPMYRGPWPVSCWSQCKDKDGKVNVICVAKELMAKRSPQPPPLNTTDLRVLDQLVMKEIIEAKYQAEYNFVKTVEQQSALMMKTVIPQCSGSGCVKQVRGIINEGIFEASQELRTGGTEVTARKIMRSAVDQSDGVIAQSKRVAELEATVKAGADQGMSSDTKTKLLVAAGVVALAAVGWAAYSRYKK